MTTVSVSRLFIPLANSTPSHFFINHLNDMTRHENPWQKRELLTRIACLFAATIIDLVSCLMYLGAMVFAAIATPIKLPFIIAKLISDENQFLDKVYHNMPGIYDLAECAYKTALFAFVALMSTPVGTARPKALVKVEVFFGLTRIPTPDNGD